MIVYIYNDNYFLEFTLPENIEGMYPLFDDENKPLANIISNGKKYEIQLSDEYIANDSGSLKKELKLYRLILLKPINTPTTFNVIMLPKYDTKMLSYNIIKDFTVGNRQDSDIFYAYNGLEGQEILSLKKNETGSGYIATPSMEVFYCNGKKIKANDKILNGDCIFYCGLKLIIVGNRIILNNPNGFVKVTSNVNIKPIDEKELKKDLEFDIRKNPKLKKDNPLYSKEDYFFKSPRFNYVIETENVELEQPPKKVNKEDQSMLLTLGPQLTMVFTSVMSMTNFLYNYQNGQGDQRRFITTMITTGVTTVGAIFWPSIARVINNRRIKKLERLRQETYTKYLDKKAAEIENIKKKQKDKMETNSPSPEKCIEIIKNKEKELWERNIDHDDFLSVRIGTGNTNTRIKIELPAEKFSMVEEDLLEVRANEIATKSVKLENVPISYSFSKRVLNAVVGKKELTKEFLDCFFLQMMTFHSYIDLKIITFTKGENEWDYLRIAPHCFDNQKSTRYYTTNVEELSNVLSELEKLFDLRMSESEEVVLEDNGEEDQEKRKDYKKYRPYYLLFIEDMTMVRNISLINKILKYKKNLGFSIIMLSDDLSTLPGETSGFICINEDESVIMTNDVTDNDKKFKADLNTNGKYEIYPAIQKLANIPLQVEKEKYELPTSLSFLEMYNVGRIEQLNSLSRWKENNPEISLAVPVGVDQSGDDFKMDIHEKAYGPHGLVAGTTGSGKSEWIITYILSLAVNFSPEEVQFVLIDYKGGGLAMSFENKELGVKLPHLAGTITNLDKSEIFRSISAIESELKRRQSVFNETREKLKEGSMNIYKYQKLYRKGLVDQPMSHLLIISDEFAELKQQQPEFMEQLISTSRIGRSLGIHLILATQKPSGVVNEQIWSNSKFKVCLKVQDESDSNEILKKPDAAFLKQTGAFYLQVGNDDYYNLGQSAYAGAKYYPSDTIKKDIDESIDYIDNLGRVVSNYDEYVEEKEVKEQGEQLLGIVSYISNISKDKDFKLSQLWLENINPTTYWGELYNKYARKPQPKYSYNIFIGEYDEPRKQTQGLLEIDLSGGHIAIMGQSDSGYESLISTIIWSSVCEHTPYEIAYYIIDFGTETLKKFAKLPHVGEVIFQSEADKVSGILSLILDELEKRKELLSDYNGSFTYYNKVSDKKLPLICCIINEYDVLLESFTKLADVFNTLFRDAAKYGIIFILSVSSPSSLRSRQLQFFNHVILLNLADDSQYRSITNCRKGLIPKKTRGRGICKLDSESPDSYCEFQTTFIAPEEQELETIKAYANTCVEHYKFKVKQLAKIPDDLSSEDLLPYISDLSAVPVGYNFYEKDIAKYNIINNKINMITGKNIADNMNFIYALTTVISKIPNVKVRVIDLLNVFKEPILDIKYFNDRLDDVIEALEKDCLTRTDSQDYGVNLLIGAGQFKQKIPTSAQEKYNNIFNNIVNSKKTTYIFIDNYEKMRTLKLEKWFEYIDTQSAIWLGPEIESQSLITVNELSSEDKKLKFKGMAYIVENGQYRIIKTAMDGDK